METIVSDFIKISVPSLIVLLTTVITLRVNKKNKRDELYYKKSIEYAEEIMILIQNIENGYQYLIRFFNLNFGHLDNIGEAFSALERYHVLYEDVTEDIKKLSENREKLFNSCTSGLLYLNESLISDIKVYLSLGEFTYGSTIISSEYYQEFWLNLTKAETNTKREKLYSSIIKSNKSLIPN